MSYSIVYLFPARDGHHLGYSYLLADPAVALVMYVILKTRKSGQASLQAA